MDENSLKINAEIESLFFDFLEWLRRNKRLKPQCVRLIKAHWLVANGKVSYKTLKSQILEKGQISDTKYHRDWVMDWLERVMLWQQENDFEILKLVAPAKIFERDEKGKATDFFYDYEFVFLEVLERKILDTPTKNSVESSKDLIEEVKAKLLSTKGEK